MVPAPAPPPETLLEDLFPQLLPFDGGPAPPGLANPTAQGCAACHPGANEGWARSAHAGPPSAALVGAAAGMPACLGCHLPLTAQHTVLYGMDGDRPVPQPNPTFDATLWLEGVGCAACHLRDGVVVTADTVTPAPHPSIRAPELGSSAGCAACHQLSWPGATAPLYDTWGEWERSAFAAAGVRCQDCHLLDAAEPARPDHAMAADPERAVSVLVALPGLTLTRGAPPVPATVTLQNTGAGHAFPTGSPYRGVRLEAWLEGPPDKKGVPLRGPDALASDLAQHVAPEPPFAITEDARLPAGGSRAWDLPLALPADAPAEGWTLRVVLRRTVLGEPQDPPFVDRRWPLTVL